MKIDKIYIKAINTGEEPIRKQNFMIRHISFFKPWQNTTDIMNRKSLLSKSWQIIILDIVL